MRRLIVLSVLSLFVTVPHAAEDFAYHEPAAVGLSPLGGGLVLAAALALQAWGLVLAARGRPAGAWLHLLVAFAWIAGDLAAHGGELLATGPYRAGPVSRGLEWAILVVMGSLALAARAALRQPRRRW